MRFRALKFFPTKHEKLIVIAIVAFCGGTIVGLLPGMDGKTVMAAVGTLVTAFAGAFFAFRLNERREAVKSEQSELGAANRAIFSLIRAYNYIAGYHKQYLAPFKGRPEAFIAIRPSIGNPNPDFKIDFDAISFLIPQGKVEILGELSEFEEVFSSFVELVRTRNHVHANIVQPAMEAAGAVDGGDIYLNEIEKALGDRLAATMRTLTEDLIETAEKGEKQSEHLIESLSEIMRDLYPGRTVIAMEKSNK